MKIPTLRDLLRILKFEKNSTQITIRDNSEPFEVLGTPQTVPYLPLSTYLSTKVLRLRDYPIGDSGIGIEIIVPDNLTYDFEYKDYLPDLEWLLSVLDLKLFNVKINSLENGNITTVYSGEYSDIRYFAVADLLTGSIRSLDTDEENVLTITVFKPGYIVYDRNCRKSQ